MANKDITVVLYDGSIKIDYKDGPHSYYARERVDYDLPEADPKAWGKAMRPKGTTTLLGDTLEKKGLMQWPKNVALRELFGFYGEFTGDNGNKVPAGFSKGVGTMWDAGTGILLGADKETALPLIESAAKGWQRKQKKGANIGTCVHSAIEAYITEEPFDIGENYMWSIKEADYESEEARQQALKEFDEDVAQATAAFNQFKIWWDEKAPKLLGAEEVIYSKEHNIAGLFDGLIELDGKQILCDWKTSNTYGEAPEGVSYDYFIQSAIYAMARHEMGHDLVDDLLIVSCRKDGGFSTVFASEVGLTVQDCIDWARAVITCYKLAAQTKAGLMAHSEEGDGKKEEPEA